jgi:hypothetical protein
MTCLPLLTSLAPFLTHMFKQGTPLPSLLTSLVTFLNYLKCKTTNFTVILLLTSQAVSYLLKLGLFLHFIAAGAASLALACHPHFTHLFSVSSLNTRLYNITNTKLFTQHGFTVSPLILHHTFILTPGEINQGSLSLR